MNKARTFYAALFPLLIAGIAIRYARASQNGLINKNITLTSHDQAQLEMTPGKRFMLVATNYACKPCEAFWQQIEHGDITLSDNTELRILHDPETVSVPGVKELSILQLRWGSGAEGMRAHRQILRDIHDGHIPTEESLSKSLGKPKFTTAEAKAALASETDILQRLGSHKTPNIFFVNESGKVMAAPEGSVFNPKS